MKQVKLTILFFVLLSHLGVCLSCQGYSHMKSCGSKVIQQIHADRASPDTLEDSETKDDPGILASKITYKITARGLTSKPGGSGPPEVLRKVWHSNTKYDDGKCIHTGNPDPNWPDAIELTYVDGSDTFVKIQLHDETYIKNLCWDELFYNNIGETIIYAKDMLVKGSVVEGPLWHPDYPNWNVGRILLEIQDVQTTRIFNTSNIITKHVDEI